MAQISVRKFRGACFWLGLESFSNCLLEGSWNKWLKLASSYVHLCPAAAVVSAQWLRQRATDHYEHMSQRLKGSLDLEWLAMCRFLCRNTDASKEMPGCAAAALHAIVTTTQAAAPTVVHGFACWQFLCACSNCIHQLLLPALLGPD